MKELETLTKKFGLNLDVCYKEECWTLMLTDASTGELIHADEQTDFDNLVDNTKRYINIVFENKVNDQPKKQINEQSNKRLSEMQNNYLEHIKRKGFGAYQKPLQCCDEMVAMGILSKDSNLSIFGETVYRPID